MPDGANAKVDVTILENVNGLTKIRSIAYGRCRPRARSGRLPGWRVIAGGRTGGAFVEGSLDNIAVRSDSGTRLGGSAGNRWPAAAGRSEA